METSSVSPRILRSSWGTIGVEGHDVPFKDVKLFPGGARAWDWKETGTNHDNGVQFADVEELLAHGAEVVVLSMGFESRLGIQDETLSRLKERGLTVHVLPTDAAILRYNELQRTEKVGALIHSTC